MVQTPPADYDVNESTLLRLLKDQHPDLAGLKTSFLDSGWDNMLFRLGPDLVARLPRRASAIPLLLNEQKWLPHLAPQLPLRVPTAHRIGVASDVFPAPWSIVPWFEGEPADRATLNTSGQAEALAKFFRALHVAAPEDAPRSLLRGVPLRRRAVWIEAQLAKGEFSPALAEVWRAALAADESAERCWIHGDPHGRNIIVDQGSIVAVIDWGDLTAGDVANDLAAFWILFDDDEVRKHAFSVYGCDDATRCRTLGWAVFYAVTFGNLVDDPIHRRTGLSLADRLVRSALLGQRPKRS
ncbi:MAG: aminoglycoside phosphotransferase family protein [Myxococcota bacterium]